MHPQLLDALAFSRGLVDLTADPQLRHLARRAVTRGELVMVLPKVYAPPGPLDADLRARALASSDPEAVLTGRWAAWALGWSEVEPGPAVTASSTLGAYPGYNFQRLRLPDRLVVGIGGLRLTSPALTAIDLAIDPAVGPAGIDVALRHGVKLERLREALEAIPHRAGNGERRLLLHDSRDKPWSEAERVAHRVLREGGVRGWTTNELVNLRPRGHAYVDIAFPKIRFGVEIDGREFHEPWPQRVKDCARDARLIALGWTVLRVPAEVVLRDPARFLADIRDAVAVRRA